MADPAQSPDESHDSIDPVSGALSGAAKARRRQIAEELGMDVSTPWNEVLAAWNAFQSSPAGTGETIDDPDMSFPAPEPGVVGGPEEQAAAAELFAPDPEVDPGLAEAPTAPLPKLF